MFHFRFQEQEKPCNAHSSPFQAPRKDKMKVLLLLLNLFALTRQIRYAQGKAPVASYKVDGEVGEPIALHCNTSLVENVDLEWYFGDDYVIIDYTNGTIDNEGNERVKFTEDLTKGDGSIIIEDLHLNDSGVYKCEWTYYSASGWVDNHILVNLTMTAVPGIGIQTHL
uniref:uncharacterized protein isoform X3 n=1 Tax=Myxine glutinosa TaxID=7769 RepID=UPI00358F1DC8